MRSVSVVGVVLLSVLLLISCSAPERSTGSPPTSTPPPSPTPTPLSEENGRWELVWADEFDGDSLDPANWMVETGAGGWGNNELQFYTMRPENLRVENGMLVIEARKEEYYGSSYTSARIKTQYKRTFLYGRFEARIKLPTGKGIWPAFWMLGVDLPTAGWPRCGEIDIMENLGDDPHTVYGTVHGPGYSGGNGVGRPMVVAEPLNEDFHVYAVEWTPTEITWFVDDQAYHSVRRDQVPGEWVFDHPFFLLLNLAVGGTWPGYPDESTVFPQRLFVDYVRVYRDTQLVLPEARGTLYVADLSLELLQESEQEIAQAYVQVEDADGHPVEGVRVRGGWLGVTHQADSQAVTDATGRAGPFRGRVLASASRVSFCVLGLDHSDYEYDKAANRMTCIEVQP